MKRSIHPGSKAYIFLLCLLGLFGFVFTGFAFYSLLWGKPIILFDSIEIKNRILQFAILFPMACLMTFFFVENLLFKISFDGDYLLAPKKSPMQIDNLKLDCKELIRFRVLFPGDKENGTIFQYLEFTLKGEETKRLWIKPFTKKQTQEILLTIQKLGGLPHQDTTIQG